MKTSIKAALWSAFVFPGLGQMYLKRYLRGLVPMLLVLAGLGILIAQAVVVALKALEQIDLQGVVMDMKAVSDLAAKSAAGGDSYSSLILLGIALCWFLSIIDAYRLGKEKEQRTEPNQAKVE
jgi:TM2 domain-containing membrane protein YozV